MSSHILMDCLHLKIKPSVMCANAKIVAIGKGTCARLEIDTQIKHSLCIKISHLTGQRDTLLVQSYGNWELSKGESGEGSTESSTEVVPGKMKEFQADHQKSLICDFKICFIKQGTHTD